jgi:Uri superfamily endonuclease
MNLQSNQPGIYTLILHLCGPQKIRIGSLGLLDFAAGFYAYTGSARGPGGLKRVNRHIQVLTGEKKTRRWHIDYLLPNTVFQEVVITRTVHDLECRIAGCIQETEHAVPKFGCTDCDCQSHLHYSGDLRQLQGAVRRAHDLAQNLLIMKK